MKKQILLLGLVIPLIGCTPNGKLIKLGDLNNCPGDFTGWSYTPVWYGDSYLAAFEITEIAVGSEWFFTLHPQTSPTDPDGVDYEEVEVTIRAKLPNNQSWLSETRVYSVDHQFSVCVPDAEAEIEVDADGVLAYDVIVEKVGELDPRAVVIRR